MQRRLAAILATDIVGYSKMMGADEAGTLSALQAFSSDILTPVTSSNSGEIVKSMGDGWLVAFSSASDAVNAAMHIQDRLAQKDSLKLRMGVHLGDVTFTEGDVFGDGVNIAARLEGAAPEGGIAISDPVYCSIDGTLAPSFDDTGEHSFKNIARPVRVWTRAKALAPTLPSATASETSGLPHLTIHPVGTSDPRRDIVELAQAITSDFGTYLAPVGWLEASVSTTDREGYALRPTLRTRGDRLRLETRLFAPDGAEISTRKFDGTVQDSFDWQDEVAEAVASDCIATILDAETRALHKRDRTTLTAETCLMAGMMAWRSFAPDAFENALEFFEQAIETNPNLREAYAEAIIVTIAGKTMGLHDLLARFDAQMPDWVAKAETVPRQK